MASIPMLATGAQDPQGDFSAIRDQDPVKHGGYSIRKSGWPDSTSDAAFNKNVGDLAGSQGAKMGLRTFIDSIMQSVCP